MTTRWTSGGSLAGGLALVAALAGCGSAASMNAASLSGVGGSSGQSSSTSGGGAGLNGSTGTTTTSGSSNGSGSLGGSSSGGSSGRGSGTTLTPSSATVSGSLAFEPAFEGEFYGLLPDGGADLTNVDCRIADGFDLWQACGVNQAAPLAPDGGATASREILDIYVTSLDNSSLTTGDAPITPTWGSDGGVYATIELTTLLNGNRGVLTAIDGDVSYEISPDGMSGAFNADFPLPDGGTATLSGAFGATYCNSLAGY